MCGGWVRKHGKHGESGQVGKWASGHLDDLKLFFRVEEDMRMNIYTIIIYNYIYIKIKNFY